MIIEPFSDLKFWVGYFCDADIPVLRHTVVELDKFREKADSLNARVLASVIMSDPLMTLRVLAYIEEHRKLRQTTDITTIERALIMIGMGPFFKDFSNIPLLEDRLTEHPKALLGVLKVIKRARNAAHWAREWAVIRKDIEVDEIIVAALLHDAAELLMWSFAPDLALKAKDMQTADRTLRSTTAQKQVFGIQLNELQLELVHAWRLPELLTQLMDHTDTKTTSRELNVMLAVNLARHSANGWDDAALPDDYKAICELLHMSPEMLMKKLGQEPPPA